MVWIKQQKCCITGAYTGWWFNVPIGNTLVPVQVVVDPAHIKTRATGGDDLYNTVPLSRHLHEEQHRIGIKAFELKYQVDLVAIARECTERFLAAYPEYREGADG